MKIQAVFQDLRDTGQMEAMQKIGLDGLLKDVTNVIGRNLLFNKILNHKIC